MKTFTGFFGNVPLMQHSLADLIQWDGRYSVGDRAIDAQDRALLQMANEIDDLWRQGAETGRWIEATDKLQRLLEGHFRTEEKLLVDVAYPRLAEHAAEHREILADLASIRAYLDGRGSRRAARAGLKLSNFIQGVLVGHVVNTDSDYCSYIADATARSSTGCA